jgi:hypothetical protein
MLKIENAFLLIIDIQGNLAHSMYGKELLIKNVQRLIKGIQILKMRDYGVSLTSVETALFELLKVAEGERFREILKIVK